MLPKNHTSRSEGYVQAREPVKGTLGAPGWVAGSPCAGKEKATAPREPTINPSEQAVRLARSGRADTPQASDSRLGPTSRLAPLHRPTVPLLVNGGGRGGKLAGSPGAPGGRRRGAHEPCPERWRDALGQEAGSAKGRCPARAPCQQIGTAPQQPGFAHRLQPHAASARARVLGKTKTRGQGRTSSTHMRSAFTCTVRSSGGAKSAAVRARHDARCALGIHAHLWPRGRENVWLVWASYCANGSFPSSKDKKPCVWWVQRPLRTLPLHAGAREEQGRVRWDCRPGLLTPAHAELSGPLPHLCNEPGAAGHALPREQREAELARPPHGLARDAHRHGAAAACGCRATTRVSPGVGGPRAHGGQGEGSARGVVGVGGWARGGGMVWPMRAQAQRHELSIRGLRALSINCLSTVCQLSCLSIRGLRAGLSLRAAPAPPPVVTLSVGVSGCTASSTSPAAHSRL
jgi:hypothetical protein